MPYDTPFYALSPQAVRFIHDPDWDIDTSYIDGLALLHDMLIGFGSEPRPAMFDDLNQLSQLLAEAGRELDVRFRQLHKPEAAEALENFSFNRTTATDLRQEFFAPSRNVSLFNLRTLADAFLDDLLDQYAILRYPDKFLQP
jgi:hypothetical protein